MRKKLMGCLIALTVLLLCLGLKAAFTEDSGITRESVISDTLKDMQGRQEAMGEAMQEAQLKQLESEVETRRFTGEKRAGAVALKSLLRRIHPYLTSVTKVEDNVYSRDADVKSRLTYKNTLGAKMNFYSRGKTLNLDAFLSNNRYQHVRQDNDVDANLNILGNLPLGRYNFSLSNEWNSLDEFEDTDDDGVGDAVDIVKRYTQNKFVAKLGRGFNRTGFDINYKRLDYFYESKYSDDDRVEETYSFNPYLKLGRKSKLEAGYSYNNTDYTHNLTLSKDSNYNDFNLTFSSVLSAKVTGLAKMDYKLTNNANDEHIRESTFTNKFSYMASVRTSLLLSLERYIKESSADSEYTRTDSLELAGSHRLAFNPRLKLSLSGRVEYETKPKEAYSHKTHTYILGSGLAYAFRQWLDLSLDYTNKRLNSNAIDSYENNTVIFKMQARF
ncbi:MAG: hypothetical protein WC321_06360 [Candidatus Omnitrophota bacterium]|jgi:hypothetical protein